MENRHKTKMTMMMMMMNIDLDGLGILSGWMTITQLVVAGLWKLTVKEGKADHVKLGQSLSSMILRT